VAGIYALSCGYLEFDRKLFFPQSERGTAMTIPVPSFLIVHPKGKVLFDTGLHCDAVSDPVARLGESMAKIYRVRSRRDENVIDQLALLGLRPDDVTHVVNSHFHFDHCGCNALFPRAQFLVQQDEMRAARSVDSKYDGKDWDHPLDYLTVDGERDVFGDGALVLLPTPGHTAGHQSLRVRAGPRLQYVLAGDACYTREHLERDLLPVAAAVWDAGAMRDSLATLRKLEQRDGATLIFGHDPRQWQEIPHAPEPMA
jgi:glyoxylase-like metal-dependent hydrolase (beta-lactamase superfamily II)